MVAGDFVAGGAARKVLQPPHMKKATANPIKKVQRSQRRNSSRSMLSFRFLLGGNAAGLKIEFQFFTGQMKDGGVVVITNHRNGTGIVFEDPDDDVGVLFVLVVFRQNLGHVVI